MLESEKDRYQESDTSFDKLFNNFPNVDEISFTMLIDEPIMSKEDVKIALEQAKNDYIYNIDYFRKISGRKIEDKIELFVEEAKRELEIKLIKEEILLDTSIPLTERYRKTRNINYRRKIRIDENDLFLYQSIYDYEIKKLCLEKYQINDKNYSNVLDNLNKHMKEIMKHVHKYSIRINSSNILKPSIEVEYFIKCDDKIKKFFISYKNGKNIGINLIKLYERSELIFAYDYNDLMYYKDKEWYNIGGTLAN